MVLKCLRPLPVAPCVGFGNGGSGVPRLSDVRSALWNRRVAHEAAIMRRRLRG
jgi:hypothetical protein